MYMIYQKLILGVRILLVLCFMMISLALTMLTTSAAMAWIAKKPHANDDPISLILVVVYMIMPVAIFLPGAACFVVWAPVDLLLGFISGKPTLLFWLNEEG